MYWQLKWQSTLVSSRELWVLIPPVVWLFLCTFPTSQNGEPVLPPRTDGSPLGAYTGA